MATEVVIVGAARTPVGSFAGAFGSVPAHELGATAIGEALRRAPGLEPAEIDDVIMGCVMQVGEQSTNIARNAVLAAGWPESVPATTIDRQCGSSQQALHFGAQGVMSGAYDVVVAAGALVCAVARAGHANDDRTMDSDSATGNNGRGTKPSGAILATALSSTNMDSSTS